MSSPKSASASAEGAVVLDSMDRAISSCFSSSRLPRRKWSMARRFAVTMSQAPGFWGTPEPGHCSSAATSASCARSSASPTSRTMRARLAMSRGDSIRQTASTVRWMSDAATGDDRITPGRRWASGVRYCTRPSASIATVFSTRRWRVSAAFAPSIASTRRRRLL